MKKEQNLRTVHIKFDYDTRLIGKTSDVRIYRNVTILTPGTYADSITNAGVKYSEGLLKRTAKEWESKYLNIDHSDRTLDRIGTVENPRFQDGKVKADLYIHPVTQNAKDVIGLIEDGLVNWLSVEILTEDDWNEESQRYVKDLIYIGLAVVTTPADPNTRIKDSGPAPDSVFYEME